MRWVLSLKYGFGVVICVEDMIFFLIVFMYFLVFKFINCLILVDFDKIFF